MLGNACFDCLSRKNKLVSHPLSTKATQPPTRPVLVSADGVADLTAVGLSRAALLISACGGSSPPPAIACGGGKGSRKMFLFDFHKRWRPRENWTRKAKRLPACLHCGPFFGSDRGRRPQRSARHHARYISAAAACCGGGAADAVLLTLCCCYRRRCCCCWCSYCGCCFFRAGSATIPSRAPANHRAGTTELQRGGE